MRGKAYRREKEARAKARASKQMKLLGFDAEDITHKSTGYYAETRTPCSCFMCGNQRKYGKGSRDVELTRQEKLADIQEREELGGK